jgi:membrane protein DedA with SNARE-associated domain
LQSRESVETLNHLVVHHGYWVVAVVVGLESMGLPLPGETTLVTSAIYAGTTHELNIWALVLAAAIGAIVGDNLGFWIGRRYGYALLLRYGYVIRLNERRIKLGQFAFERHGGKVVFFGRFVAFLRVVAALLAGINCMDWRRFLLFNALGGIVWATLFALAGYVFGEKIEAVKTSFAVLGIVLAVLGCIAGMWFVRRHEAALEAQAERAHPGPLRAN